MTNPLPGQSGLCWFMLQRLPPLLEAFKKEITGVKVAEDIEYIHRMRVASRRLRAALPLFRDCFPRKQYGRWMAEIANITRALGDARDTDVQIAFLTKYQKKRTAAWRKLHPEDGSELPVGPAVRYLLADLRKRRERLQDRVLSALDALDKSRVIPEIERTLTRLAAGSGKIPWKNLVYGIPALAAIRIETRLATMLSYGPWVHQPDAVAEHHATRIAAKKLRYTMEVYGPVYRRGLVKPHARVKKVQEILGDLHDCDVWIDHVTRLLLRERARFRSVNGEKRPDTATLASLKLFLLDREKERVILHRQFMRYWGSMERAGIWDELRSTLLSGRRQRFVPRKSLRPEEILAAADARASDYPELLTHERHVTRLALMLFDSLQSLHGLGPDDRTLLASAGLLHDIGWQGGRRKHHIRSAEAVIADEYLPLDISQRAIIVLCILAHRGRTPPEKHSLYMLLSLSDRQKALRLASLLRIADGLDYPHQGNVHTIRCTMDRDRVICDVTSPLDVTVEKEHARVKADLFFRTFERELVIR